jgi:hypothetical protein
MTTNDATALTVVQKAANLYVMDGAVLTISSWRAKGQANIADHPYDLAMTGLFDRRACASAPGGKQPTIILGRKGCVLPSAADGTWRVKGRFGAYHAMLRVAGVGEIELHLGRRRRSPVEVVVHGQWPMRDLIVVTAAFALLVRRRDDDATSAGAAVATITATTGG